MQRTQAAVEAGFAAVAIAIGGLVLAGTRDIPPALYDPLGSAALPCAAAGLVILLALTMAVRSLSRLRAATTGRPAHAETAAAPERNLLAAGFVGATIAYAAAMQAGWLGYREATLAFFVVAGLMLARGRRRLVVPILVTALAISVGGYQLFTQLFYVALP